MAKFVPIDRPWKRKIQQELANRLAANNLVVAGAGRVVGLSGPEPKKAIAAYSVSVATGFSLCESDTETYQKARENMSCMDLSEITLYKRDIFDLLFYYSVTTPYVISGIDFDFCETLYEALCQKIVIAVRALLKGTSKSCIWVRIASSMRGIGKQQTYANIAAIRDQCLIGIPWHLEDEVQATYTDQGAMGIWQGIFVRNGAAQEKKEKTMKTTKMNSPKITPTLPKKGKTLKQLNKKDRLMVQVLAMNLGPGLELKDVQKKFDLSNGTVAALRAWQTMRGN
jgi:hypothetical protein